MYVHLNSVLSLAAGILVLVFPKILNYIIAFYLIAIGVAGMVQAA